MLKLYLTTILAISHLAVGLEQRIVEGLFSHQEDDTSYFASGSVVVSSLSAPLLAWRPGSGTLEARNNSGEASATLNITSTLTSSGMVPHYVAGWML